MLGSVNGFAQTLSALMRCFAPLIGGALWSWSLQSRLPFPFNHHFVFVLLIVVNLSVVGISWSMLNEEMYTKVEHDEAQVPLLNDRERSSG